ncbi:hypothetical protein BHM03_00060526, partial [Ensete ventricosum]
STSTSGATFSGSVESSSLEKHESYHSTCVVQELSQLLESYCYRRKPKSRRGRVCRRYRARSGEEKSNDVSYDLPEPRAQPAKMSSAEEGISTNRVEPKMRKKKPPLHLAVVTTHRKRGCQRRVRGDLAGSVLWKHWVTGTSRSKDVTDVGVLQECDGADDWSIKGSVAGSVSERVAEATTARGRSSRRNGAAGQRWRAEAEIQQSSDTGATCCRWTAIE